MIKYKFCLCEQDVDDEQIEVHHYGENDHEKHACIMCLLELDNEYLEKVEHA